MVTTTSLLLAAALALSSSSPVDASPLTTIPGGRHAPPYLASKLGNHKRALGNYLRKMALGGGQDDALVASSSRRHDGKRAPASIDLPLSARELEQLSRRASSSLPSGWTSQGCVDESSGNVRLLGDFAFSSDLMNARICTTICGGMGYPFAGTEWSSQCWCGSQLTGDGGQASSGCTAQCSGAAGETCGGNWLLNLYTFNASTSTGGSGGLGSFTQTSQAPVATQSTQQQATATAASTGTAASSGSSSGTSTGGSSSVATGTVVASSTSTSSLSPSPSTNATSGGSSSSEGGVSEWYNTGCAWDNADKVGGARTFPHIAFQEDPATTIDKCLIACEDAGFSFAGLEYGQECYCSNTAPTEAEYVSDALCNMTCIADSTEMCGGNWALSVWELLTPAEATDCGYTSGQVVPGSNSSSSNNSTQNSNLLVNATLTASASASGATNATSTAIGATNATSTASATKTPTMATTSALVSATAVTSTKSASKSASASATTATAQPASTVAIPASSASHAVYAHFMVGNTYGYDQAHWASDIALAAANGIDGFALNMGSMSWEPARVQDAYNAAAAQGSFKLFLSLDMTSLPCGSASDAANLVSLVQTFASSSAQATMNGKTLVSTFSGESCTFGTGNIDTAWGTLFKGQLKTNGVDITFAPSLFIDPSQFSQHSWLDAELNWNSGWPMGGSDLTTASDTQYMSALSGKGYMPAISPAFFTHFPPSGWNKNWIYRGDDWLYATRWEQVISMRASVQATEILTWNDYGESSYIGPIDSNAGDLPAGSSVWVDNFPHTAWLEMTKYYATAFKTGAWPTITGDVIYAWERPHPKAAVATADSMSRPTGWQNTDDNLYAMVFAKDAGTLTLNAGSTSQTFAVTAGVNKVKMPSAVGSFSAQLTRGGSTVASLDSGSFSYTNTPATYNFNYYVASSNSS